jgi:hypothetical protein
MRELRTRDRHDYSVVYDCGFIANRGFTRPGRLWRKRMKSRLWRVHIALAVQRASLLWKMGRWRPDDKHTRLPLRPCASRIAEWLSAAKLGERRQSVRGVSIFVPVEKCSASLGHRGVEAKFRNLKRGGVIILCLAAKALSSRPGRERDHVVAPSSGSGADQSVGQAEHHEREREHRNRRDGIFEKLTRLRTLESGVSEDNATH